MKKQLLITVILSTIFLLLGSNSPVSAALCPTDNGYACSGDVTTLPNGGAGCSAQTYSCASPGEVCWFCVNGSTTGTCQVYLSSFTVGYINLNNNFVAIPNGGLVVSSALKDGQLTARMSAGQNGNCNDGFNKVVNEYYWNDSRPDANTGPLKNYSTRWVYTLGASMLLQSTNIALNQGARNYMMEGQVGGDAKNNSWSIKWDNTTLLYEQVSDTSPISINPDTGNLTGIVTLPWFNTVAGPNSSLPNYYILINSDPATTTDQSSNTAEIQLDSSWFSWGNFKGSPDWQVDVTFNHSVSSLNLAAGTTYYWRLRQQGSAVTTYIPGNTFTTPPGGTLTGSPSQGVAPLTTTLTATVLSATNKWPINYSFWWNCSYPGSDINTMRQVCGDPDQTFTNVSSNTQAVTHAYGLASNQTAKFIAVLSNGQTTNGEAALTINQPVAFYPGWQPAGAVINNKMWVISERGNPAFSSADGASWNQEMLPTLLQPISVTRLGNMIFFNNRLWMLGHENYYRSEGPNYIYATADGLTWNKVGSLPLADPVMASRYPQDAYYNGSVTPFSNIVEFNNKLLFLGPDQNGSTIFYSSADGNNWTKTGPWSATPDLSGNRLISFNNKIWLLGGTYYGGHKIYSFDGTSWSEAGSLPEDSIELIKNTIVFHGKIWGFGAFEYDSSTNRYVNTGKIYSFDGSIWHLEGTLPEQLAQSFQLIPLVYQDKIWLIAEGNVAGYERGFVFSAPDGKNWTSMLAPCTGNVNLYINPTTIARGSGYISPVISGLSNCPGKIAFVQTDNKNLSSGVATLCSSSDSGCIGYPFLPDYPDYRPGNYTYYAAIDKNDDGDILDPGEVSLPVKVTLTAQPTQPGGGPGGTGTQVTSPLGCADAGDDNRATGLVSTPHITDQSRFNTSGGCTIDPKAAFTPIKIPTFDDLKSLYYNQN